VSATSAEVESALSIALGRPTRIERRVSLAGGDISEVERLETVGSRQTGSRETRSQMRFVLKSDRHGTPGLFPAEAAGLAALAQSGTSLRIPRVVALRSERPAFLVLEDLGTCSRRAGFEEAVGRGLAELHRSTADRFGFDTDTFCGTTPQPNAWMEDWRTFYGRARLGHQLGLAAQAGLLSNGDRMQVERLIGRLDRLLTDPAEGPALIHGDLWSGNLHVCADGEPALIDPAVYYAHREAELGMMTLFGGFSARTFAAYDEALPLDPGWRERNPIYQLYHLLNHLNLFGSGYHGQVMAVVRRYV
jgi:fructosamine-3-kinase